MPSTEPVPSGAEIPPLCVDLDGTLVKTDMLLESLLMLLRRRPLALAWLPLWLWAGKARLKAEIASRVDLSEGVFPFNQEVLDYVRGEQAHRHTVLITGSHESVAHRIAEQTGAFDEVQGSNLTRNLTRENKRAWLVARFGTHGYDYIGNDREDLPPWQDARKALVVSSPEGIASREDIVFSRVFNRCAPAARDLLQLLRVHQWVKNTLILVPFCLDRRFTDLEALTAVTLAFVAMCLLASLTYIVNDLVDLQADRHNGYRSRRPLASGRVTIGMAVKLIGVLAIGVLVLATRLPMAFNALLCLYLVLTLAYSFHLKRYAILDVGIIAALHTLRVIGGSLVIAAAHSFWLLAFSMFLFFSLAVAKRVAELINLGKSDRGASLGRGYQVSDIPVLIAFGVGTGCISVLIVALYINSAKVLANYHEPMVLWMVCPILMYWISRLWLKTARGLMHEDPIVFALSDRVSRITVLLLILVVSAAMLL